MGERVERSSLYQAYRGPEVLTYKQPMTLSDLVYKALGERLEPPKGEPTPELNVQVTGIAQDHRRIEPGMVFVARRGSAVDAHRFIRLAIESGAAAVVGEKTLGPVLPWRRVPYIQVEDDKVALAKLAATFYEHPSQSLTTFGVTGTDGKTTVSYLLHHLLQADEQVSTETASASEDKAGLISTAAAKVGRNTLDLAGHFTTPEATDVQRLLATFRDEGCKYAVVESSSHGFALHRLDEVRYDIGIWTNLSPEHLDFHGSLAAYRDAKLNLVRRAQLSILNRDDAAFGAFRDAAQAEGHKVVSYGGHPDSDWRADDLVTSPGAQAFTVYAKTDKGQVARRVHLPMVGRYNVSNALAALAAAHLAGVPLDVLARRLEGFGGVPGRMQVVRRGPVSAVVDFAHTPPALQKVLRTLRTVTSGRLIVVVGAAGERDPGKRLPLGETAMREADLCIFTEEDSRSEDINEILATLARGAVQAGGKAAETYWCIPDRREAIRVAVATAAAGDTVVFAGKGHERTLERAAQTLPWDEVAEVEQALTRVKKDVKVQKMAKTGG